MAFFDTHDFQITNTRISGALPKALFSLPKVEKFHLINNRLTGTIPDQLSLYHVVELMLSQNYLAGTLPTTIHALMSLENFEGPCCVYFLRSLWLYLTLSLQRLETT